MRPLTSKIAAAAGALVLLGGGTAVALALTPADHTEVVEHLAPIVVEPAPAPETPEPSEPVTSPVPVPPQTPIDVDDDDDDDDDDNDDDDD